MGVDAVEPDVVVSRDGVLVVRHENEISGTTDVASHAKFADRRTTRIVDGDTVTGWFAEDFTWDELSQLRATERLPELRADSATHDGEQPILRLSEVLRLVDEASARLSRRIAVVLEVKHATYFASRGFDMAALVSSELAAAGWDAGAPLIIESFEQSVLMALQQIGVPAQYVYLLEAKGSPADLIAERGDGSVARGAAWGPMGHGGAGATYADAMTERGLDALAQQVDGISLSKRTILAPDVWGHVTGPSPVVAAAHERGLAVYTWTCRPENHFLVRGFRDGSDAAAWGDWRSEWGVLKAARLDGVFVDHPDLGVEFFRG